MYVGGEGGVWGEREDSWLEDIKKFLKTDQCFWIEVLILKYLSKCDVFLAKTNLPNCCVQCFCQNCFSCEKKNH